MGKFIGQTSRLNWPRLNPSYQSAVPGLAGFGLDFGVDKPSKMYFINNWSDDAVGASDPSKGPNCFSGSACYCMQADQGATFSKWVVPLVGGYVYIGRKLNSPVNGSGRGDLDYLGQAAPGPGLILRCVAMRIAGGSNVRIWHCASWMGDEPANTGIVNLTIGERDCLQATLNPNAADNIAFINCECRFWMDEGMEWFNQGGKLSWLRGIMCDPLHAPPGWGEPGTPNHHEGDDHGFAHVIGGNSVGPVIAAQTIQSTWAHATDRNPTSGAIDHAHINNLHYNHGRPGGGKGSGFKFCDLNDRHIVTGTNQRANMAGCMSVRGPENNDQLCMAETVGSFVAGSHAHTALSCQFGWTSPATQDDFWTNKPSGFMVPNIIPSAWPDGYGLNYEGVLRPAANLLNPSVYAGLAFVQLMRSTVGMKPKMRKLYSGGTNRIFDQIDRRILGIGGGFEYINAVADLPEGVGGWPVIPTYGPVDPTAPGAEWHAPIPMDSTRDDILLSGTFSNGMSKVGYSKLRAWAIEQDLFVREIY